MGSQERPRNHWTPRHTRMRRTARRRSGGPRGHGRAIFAGSAALVFFVPMAVVTLGTGGAGATPSNDNTNGILKYGFDINDEFGNFDPATSLNDCGYTVMSNIYQSVTAPGQYDISGGVAQSWSISNNAETVTLHIRPNMVFSNGQPVTSTDVMTSLLNTKTSPLRSSLFNIASISTPDPDTAIVQLDKPTAGDFLWAMTYIDGMVYPTSSIPTAATAPIGAGPFMLKSYQPGSSIDLVKNPKYWDSAAYPLGGVDFVEVSTGPQAVSAITSGAVDMISLDPQQYTEVEHDSNIGVSITQSYDYAVLNTRNDVAPFNNPEVRAALEYSIDRAIINKVVYAGVGRPAYQPFPSNSPGYNKTVGDKYVYDPKKAKAMLAAAGYPHGVSFKMDVPSGDTTEQRLATILQSEMAAAGFNASITLIPGADVLEDVYIKKEGNALLSEDLTNGPDISNTFEAEFEPTGFPAKYLGTEDLAITPAIEAANASLSPSLQGPLMQKVGATIMAQGLETPIEFEPAIIAYNKSVVGGKVVAPIGQCRSDLAGIYIKK
ncbi:MAG: ABC transporter substrate-binding protein [Acidimicrobiales bacterium]